MSRGEHYEMNRELRKFWFSDGLDVQLARVAWHFGAVCLNTKRQPEKEKVSTSDIINKSDLFRPVFWLFFVGEL